MMKRSFALLALAFSVTLIGLLLVAPLTVWAQGGGHGDDDHGDGDGAGDDEVAALRGAAVFAEFCQACHGPRGEALAAGPSFPAITFHAEAAHTAVAEGVDHDPDDGVAMPAYGDVLTGAQIDDVLAYMATWGTGETPPLPEPHLAHQVDHVPDYFGDPHAGAALYATSCAGCHGAEGQGRDADQFPKLTFDARTTRTLIASGTQSVYMPGFGVDAGGPLDEKQLDDLEAYLASWALEDTAADSGDDSGIAVLIVVSGIAALVAVGTIHLMRAIPENKANTVDRDIFPDR